MSRSSANVRRIVAYTLATLVILFSAVTILAIWDVIDYDKLIKRMFQSLMVIMASAAVIVLIFSILDRGERDENKPLNP